MKNVLILGDQGYIGFRLSQVLRAPGNDCTVTGRDLASAQEACLDVTNAMALRQCIESLNPDVVMYCSGCRIFESQSDPAMAYRINVEPVRQLSEYFRGKLVYFSSCHVFGGQRACYQESDTLLPTSVYGKSKAEAEAIIAANMADYLIVRPGYVYGYNGRQHDHFTSTVLLAHEQQRWPLRCDDRIVRRPIALNELCSKVTSLLCQRDIKLLQINGNVAVTKHEWAGMILRTLGYADAQIKLCLQVEGADTERFIARNAAMHNTLDVQDDYFFAMAEMGRSHSPAQVA